MMPKKSVLEKAQKAGAVDKAAFLLSLSYVVMAAPTTSLKRLPTS